MGIKYVVYGAGGIGGVIGARLFQSGADVTLIARGEHGSILQSRGLRLISPQADELVRIPTVLHPGELRGAEDALFLMCMKSQHTQEAMADLARTFGARPLKLACVQNGVANERLLKRAYRDVYATLVNLPATFLVPGEVLTHAEGCGGVLDTGCYPSGVDETAETMVADLAAAGFSAYADAAVMRLKYAKLLTNLLNVVQAAAAPEVDTRDFARRVRREALDVFAAAGIDCAGRDEYRERIHPYMRMADIPGHARQAGSSWQSLARGTGNIETEYLNGEIVLLAAQAGLPAPANAACVAVARALVSGAVAPQSVGIEAFAALEPGER